MSMKSLLLFAFIVLLCPIADGAEVADSIVGKWWFPERNGQMEITQNEGIFSGKVISYDKPGALDDANPDPKLQTRPFVGITMLDKFKFDPKTKKWIDGTIYDGDSGKTYSCKLWFEKGDLSKLNARGFIGVSLFGRTEVFARVTPEEEKNPPAAPQSAAGK